MAADSTLVSAVDRMRKGEEEGFNYVYSRTFNYVYFRARSIMKNEDDARDLTQIVYMEAYKSIGTLDSPENIFSWLGGITYRQGMKLFRKKTDVLLDEDFEGVFENIVSTDNDTQPELSAEGQERASIVKEAIESLPEVQKMTVIAFYYDGMKVEEIADMMDCSTGTVKSRLNYARKAMKKSLMRNPRLGRGSESSAERALKLLSFPVIFCAIQSMSESTVMAAPAAQALYAGICQGIGLTAGSIITAAAGTAAVSAGAAGSGISAASAASAVGSATGSTVSAASVASAAMAAGAGSVSAGTAAITGTATAAGAGAAIGGTLTSAAATSAASAATVAGSAIGTAAVTGGATAGAAAAGSAAAVGAATAAGAATAGAATAAVGTGVAVKSAAIALAVAVTGAGVGVGSHVLHENSVSTASVSYNAEYESDEDEDEEEIAEAVDFKSDDGYAVSMDTPESLDEFLEEVIGESAVSGNDLVSEETVSDSVIADAEAIREEWEAIVSGNEVSEADLHEENSIEEQTVSSNKSSKDVETGKSEKSDRSDKSVSENVLIPISANEAAFKITEKAKNLIAESVASMVLLTGSDEYDGPVSNDLLKAWHGDAGKYLAQNDMQPVDQGVRKLIREPIVHEAIKKDSRVTVSGSFVIDSKDASGLWKSEIYVFTLGGFKDGSEVRYGKIQSDTLKVVNVSNKNSLEPKSAVSENASKDSSVSVNDTWDAPNSVSADLPVIIEYEDGGDTTGTSMPAIVDYPSEGDYSESLTGVSMSGIEPVSTME